MSLLGSLFSAASGLGAHADAMDVIGDNIANVNTIGYKTARGRFEDVLGSTVASAPENGIAGQGSRMSGVEQIFSQGTLLGTGNSTDLAIQGEGFFLVSGSLHGVNGTMYTRNGQFHLDANGVLTDANGLRVQGYAADGLGNISATLGDISVPPTAMAPPQITSSVTMAANLDGSSTIPPAWDPLNPGTTSNFSTSVTVYDSLGAAHNVDVYFRQSAPGAWEWHAMVDGGELTGGTAGVPTQCANGTLTFTTDGYLDTEATVASDFDFLNATQNQAIALDFGDSITTDAGTGQAGVTAYASPSAVSSITQDGFASGALAAFSVAEDGTVTGTFTNGDRRTIGQIAVARFRNNEGLVRAGSGCYVASNDSGLPLIGVANAGGRGSIAAGALEQSNVDLAQEFVNMIAVERGFQANSRTVQTADAMLTELVNIKR